jgi:hypothetical protein
VTPPVLNLSVIGPVAVVGLGAMFVLVGEVTLSRAKTFLGRPVTASRIGTLLAIVSILSLGIATYMAADTASSGITLAFDPGHPMFQLDPFLRARHRGDRIRRAALVRAVDHLSR